MASNKKITIYELKKKKKIGGWTVEIHKKGEKKKGIDHQKTLEEV